MGRYTYKFIAFVYCEVKCEFDLFSFSKEYIVSITYGQNSL